MRGEVSLSSDQSGPSDFDLWGAALAYVYAHPDAPEGIELWIAHRVDRPWRPRALHYLDESAPDTPSESAPQPLAAPLLGESQTITMAEGEVRGVPFGFAWSREFQRVYIALPASAG
jgi:hypothetical protein